MYLFSKIIFGIIVFFLPLDFLYAQSETSLINENKFLYTEIPDITLNTPEGSKTLSYYWKRKPLILTFIYSRCSGVCPAYIQSLSKAVEKAGGLNDDYYLVVISFDSLDNITQMENICYPAGVNRNRDFEVTKGEIIATSSAGQINSLAAATGFWYKWNSALNGYDHPSQIVAVSRGRIIRIIRDNSIDISVLKQVIYELKGEYLTSYPLPSSDVLFRCFQYDARKDKVNIDWGFLILFAPFVMTLSITAFIFRKKK